MSTTRLRIYINDHLALMVGEMELLERCGRSNVGTELAIILTNVERDVEAQQAVARQLITRLGGTQSRLKQGAAWIAEKLGRFKMNDSLLKYSDLSRLVELETLCLAAYERVAFWDSLSAVLGEDPDYVGLEFATWRDTSRRHAELLDAQRHGEAKQALLSSSSSGSEPGG